MAGVRKPKILTTRKWGAKKAKSSPVVTGRPDKIIFHHTAGHHPEIENPQNESVEEAMSFARQIQNDHMFNPRKLFNDSGHNFLVCKNGMILVGRHLSLSAVRAGRMVVSAHCPGANDQPGIEHEHFDEPRMPPKQLEASARLHAWIMSRCGIEADQIFPHKNFVATGCPAQLEGDIKRVKKRAKEILAAEGRDPATDAQGEAFAARH
jgi:N-acetylmuramoyl-L-alanine amidase